MILTSCYREREKTEREERERDSSLAYRERVSERGIYWRSADKFHDFKRHASLSLVMLNNDETVSLTVTQNESPPTIAEQPYFHQLAPQSLLHSLKVPA